MWKQSHKQEKNEFSFSAGERTARRCQAELIIPGFGMNAVSGKLQNSAKFVKPTRLARRLRGIILVSCHLTCLRGRIPLPFLFPLLILWNSEKRIRHISLFNQSSGWHSISLRWLWLVQQSKLEWVNNAFLVTIHHHQVWKRGRKN